MPQPSAPFVSTGENSIQKRKKKLSKRVYGTSHAISREEARFIHEKGAELLIIGTGLHGRMALSDEARQYLKKCGYRIILAATPEAIQTWNTATDKTIVLFHVTC